MPASRTGRHAHPRSTLRCRAPDGGELFQGRGAVSRPGPRHDRGGPRLRGSLSRRGSWQRPKFELATTEFDTALAKLSALELSGSGHRAEERAFQRKRYLENAPKVLPAYRRLLEAVEKDPDLGKKHMDGVAYLGSLEELPKDVQEADLELEVAGRLTRDAKCE